jgi:predicted ATPase
MAARLTHLRLVNWRNFKNVDLPLSERMFVVGPNAAGKTNLLDAFRFLRDIASPGGSLVNAVGDRRDVKHLRSLHARTKSEILVEVELIVDGDALPWRYSLEISGTSARGGAQIRREIVHHGQVQIRARPDAADKADPVLLTQTLLEQNSQNGAFRPLVRALASLVHVHVVPQVAKNVVRAEELSKRDAPGSDFIEQLALLTVKQQAVRLRRIERLLRRAVPRFSELRVERDKKGFPHLEAKYEHWRPQGGWQNEHEFSDGTLRLIGLFWAIENGAGPLLLEEPELSLQADIVKQLPRLLSLAASRSQRQFIVVTHSEEMLSDKGLDLSEIVVLEPTGEETLAKLGSQHPELIQAILAKVPLGRAVRSLTKPKGIEQLSLPGLS